MESTLAQKPWLETELKWTKTQTRNEERQDKVRCWALASAARLKLKNIYIFILTCERVLKGEKYKWQIRATGQESVVLSSWWAELHKLTELNQQSHSHCILKLHFGSPLVQFILIQLQRSNQHPFPALWVQLVWRGCETRIHGWQHLSLKRQHKCFTLQSHNGSACVTHMWTWIRLITSQTDQNFTKTNKQQCRICRQGSTHLTLQTGSPQQPPTGWKMMWYFVCAFCEFKNLRTAFQLNQSNETTAGCVLIENPPRTEHRKKTKELLMVSVRQSFSNVCFRVKWHLWGKDLILNRMCLCVVSGVAWDQLLRLGQFLSSPL